MNHYTKFLLQKKAEGLTDYEAAHAPGAMEAAEMDKKATSNSFKTRTIEQHIEGFLRQRAAEGKPPYFEDQEEMLSAIQDEEYSRNEAYRSAVAAIINQTPAEIVGVAGYAKDNLGQTVKIGRGGLTEAATVESMEREAYNAMIREEYGKIDRSTAKGRYQYMQMLKDPKNAEALAEIESMMVTPEQMRRYELQGEKASGGGNLRVQGGQEPQANPKDINFEKGTYSDGSPLPLGQANIDGKPVA
jgi:hypothetical protein